ncbi:MAG TPA: SagB/ThcOx family dehydrogenase [Armatimonadota bacterium]|nr:SagB/ThcOx family dehydrogenase [Armatimonadota bacterium]
MKRLAAATAGESIPLPPGATDGRVSLEQAVARRRSCRRFAPDPLTVEQLAQLLWAAQGVTAAPNLRAAPSAGACYPLEVYIACEHGVFRYHPREHALAKTAAGDRRSRLAQAALGQAFVAAAPVTLVFAAVYDRTTRRYGERGQRYVHLDAGCAAENAHLQAEALDLGSVAVGAFNDDAVAEVLELPEGEHPLYLIPVGRRAGGT